ncbi:hypothetical protein LguiA_012150 [Lonicera macranthoides]
MASPSTHDPAPTPSADPFDSVPKVVSQTSLCSAKATVLGLGLWDSSGHADFLTATTNTTAIAVEWALAELMNNLKVLDKAQKETDKVIGHHRLSRFVRSVFGLTLTPLIGCAESSLHLVKENIRLHPSIPMLIRKSVKECTSLLTACFLSTLGPSGEIPNTGKAQPDGVPSSWWGRPNGKWHHYQRLPFESGRRGCHANDPRRHDPMLSLEAGSIE